MGTHTNQASLETRRVMDAIRQIVRVLRVASRAAEQRFGLSGAQLFVLQKLGAGQAKSLNELADRTLTHQSSASVVVQRLVERRLVARTPDRRDTRRIVLSLTPKGHALVLKSPQAAQERLIESIENLSSSQRGELAKLLEKIVSSSIDDAQPAPLFFEEPEKNQKRKK